MRAFVVLAAVLVGAAVAVMLPNAPSVRACSLVAFGSMGFEQHLEDATVVALGTFEQSERETVVLRVQEYFKGSQDGDALSINNHELGVGANCSPSIHDSGFRFPDGERVLIFLEEDAFGITDWQPTHFGYGVVAVEGDALLDWTAYAAREHPTVDQVRAVIEQNRDEPTAIDYESTPPCEWEPANSPLGRVGEYTRLSTIVATGWIEAGTGELATFHVSEYLKGEQPKRELTVNNRHLHLPMDGCGLQLENELVRFPEAQEVILFLRPDEFDIGADVRPVAWSQGVLAIRGDYAVRYPGLALLDQVRELAGGSVVLGSPATTAEGGDHAPEPAAGGEEVSVQTPVATQAPTTTAAEGSDGGSFIWPLVGGGLLLSLLAAMAGWIWARRR